MRPEIKPIKDDMTLDELENQLHLRMALKDALLEGQSDSRQKWILREINKLAQDEKSEWSTLKKEKLIENLKHFDECRIKWRAPEVQVESLTTFIASDRKEVSPGQLTTKSMRSVVQALEHEKKEMLGKLSLIETGEGTVGLQEPSTIISEKTKKIMASAQGRLDVMNEVIKKIKIAEVAPLTPESLQYAQNMHGTLKQLKEDMKPIGSEKVFIKDRSGINKIMNVIHKEIPKKPVMDSRADQKSIKKI